MDGYIGEIRAFGFNYAPVGWALCNGQQMSIQQQSALYAVIGINYGGDGRNYFNLPNIQGCAAMDAGTGSGLTPRTVGKPYGQNSVALTSNQLPPHSHSVKVVTTNNGGDAANSTDPTNNYWAKGFSSAGRKPASPTYISSAVKTQAVMAPNMVQPAGAVTPAGHTNMQPYLVFNMCICLEGEFPVRP